MGNANIPLRLGRCNVNVSYLTSDTQACRGNLLNRCTGLLSPQNYPSLIEVQCFKESKYVLWPEITLPSLLCHLPLTFVSAPTLLHQDCKIVPRKDAITIGHNLQKDQFQQKCPLRYRLPYLGLGKSLDVNVAILRPLLGWSSWPLAALGLYTSLTGLVLSLHCKTWQQTSWTECENSGSTDK